MNDLVWEIWLFTVLISQRSRGNSKFSSSLASARTAMSVLSKTELDGQKHPAAEASLIRFVSVETLGNECVRVSLDEGRRLLLRSLLHLVGLHTWEKEPQERVRINIRPGPSQVW